MLGTTPYRTPREAPNDVSRPPTPAISRLFLARASRGGRASRQLRSQNRVGEGKFDHAAPHRGSVPLGGGCFSAEQRGGAIKQQCQSTAQGRLPASVARLPHPVLQRQARHAAAAVAAFRPAASKGMDSFVRRERSAPRPGTHPLQKRILRATSSWFSGSSCAAPRRRTWSQKRDVKKVQQFVRRDRGAAATKKNTRHKTIQKRRPPRWNASRRRRPSSPTSAPRRA